MTSTGKIQGKTPKSRSCRVFADARYRNCGKGLRQPPPPNSRIRNRELSRPEQEKNAADQGPATPYQGITGKLISAAEKRALSVPGQGQIAGHDGLQVHGRRLASFEDGALQIRHQERHPQ